MANQETIDKGQAAQALMESEIFRTAMRELRDQIFMDWQSVATSDQVKRESLFYLSRGLIGVEEKLLAMAQNKNQELKKLAERQQQVAAKADE